MIDVEAERARFQRVTFGPIGNALLTFDRHENGDYKNLFVDGAFCGWLAAKRDALSTGTIPAEPDKPRHKLTRTDEE